MEFFSELKDFRTTETKSIILKALDRAFVLNSPERRVIEFLHNKKDLNPRGKIHVIGFGKAGIGMYEGARKYFGSSISGAQVIVPATAIRTVEGPFLPGNHPFPGEDSIRSSMRLIESLKGIGSDDLVVVLVSGGGSALFEVLRDGFTLKEYNAAVNCVMRSGANISELNAVRYLYSRTKGGGLLNFTRPAKVLSLIVSDVPGDSPDTVASGPTAEFPSQPRVENAIAKFGSTCNLPKSVPTATPNGYSAENSVVLRNHDFVASIIEVLEDDGFKALDIGSGIEGSTESVGRRMVERMRASYATDHGPVFVVGGGETSTNYVHNGVGGRNLELVLRVLLLMEKDEEFAFGSIGTDGIDGTSNAMGAIVDNFTLESLDRGLIVKKLSSSDSLAPLLTTRDVLFTGLTGNNVSDVFIGYYAGKKAAGLS